MLSLTFLYNAVAQLVQGSLELCNLNYATLAFLKCKCPVTNGTSTLQNSSIETILSCGVKAAERKKHSKVFNIKKLKY